MRHRRIAAAAAVCISALMGAVQAETIVVWSTLSAREALVEIVPEFEHTTGHKIAITFAGGSDLARRIAAGTDGDLFIGPEEFSGPLIAQGRLDGGARTAFASSSTGVAVRAGARKPDIGTPEALKRTLQAARTVSYSTGVSGIQFTTLLTKFDIADSVAAKRVAPRPGELVGAVVARGDAEIGIQQISELLPVAGIDIVGPLPAELRQAIVYGATMFSQSSKREVTRAFIDYLRSESARAVLRRKGLDPA